MNEFQMGELYVLKKLEKRIEKCGNNPIRAVLSILRFIDENINKLRKDNDC